MAIEIESKSTSPFSSVEKLIPIVLAIAATLTFFVVLFFVLIFFAIAKVLSAAFAVLTSEVWLIGFAKVARKLCVHSPAVSLFIDAVVLGVPLDDVSLLILSAPSEIASPVSVGSVVTIHTHLSSPSS